MTPESTYCKTCETETDIIQSSNMARCAMCGDSEGLQEMRMANGDPVQIYAADNKWHDAVYVGEKQLDGTHQCTHVVEIDGKIWEGAFVKLSVFTIDDAKEVVAAWESLKGDRRHSPSDIQNWLIKDMKPIIDKLRRKINDK